MPLLPEPAPVPIRRDIRAAFDREWDRLGRPGTWLTGVERVAVFEAGRAGPAATSGAGVPEPLRRAAAVLGSAPGSMTRADAEAVAGEVGYPAYVEMVGIAARGVSALEAVTIAADEEGGE